VELTVSLAYDSAELITTIKCLLYRACIINFLQV
jgi:hypothetical protein